MHHTNTPLSHIYFYFRARESSVSWWCFCKLVCCVWVEWSVEQIEVIVFCLTNPKKTRVRINVFL